MISSKIGSKDSWKTDRLENKEEYVESIITVIGCSVGGYEMFKTLLGCDSELKYDIGGIDDDKNIKWYEDHIRKQLMKLELQNGIKGAIKLSCIMLLSYLNTN